MIIRYLRCENLDRWHPEYWKERGGPLAEGRNMPQYLNKMKFVHFSITMAVGHHRKTGSNNVFIKYLRGNAGFCKPYKPCKHGLKCLFGRPTFVLLNNKAIRIRRNLALSRLPSLPPIAVPR